MAQWLTAPLSSKAQLTLPKRVRELLGVREKGDRVGFLVDEKSHRITITKVDLVPAEEPYTDEELRKLLKLAKEPGGKTFETGEQAIRYLDRLVARRTKKSRDQT